jgi:hypothetical protein
MKIVIFSNTLIFQMYLRKKIVCPFIITACIDSRRKIPEVVSFHTKTSGSTVKTTVIKRNNKVAKPPNCNLLKFFEI